MKLPAIAAKTTCPTISTRLVHGFIHPELTTFKFAAVGTRNGGACFFIATHFDKAESFRIAGLAIKDDLCGGNTSEAGKERTKTIFGGVVREITDIQFLGH